MANKNPITEAAMRIHIEHAIATRREIAVGQGYNWLQSGIWTRLGHTDTGWYVSGSWAMMESYDEDPSSQVCRCKLSGKSHHGIHRVAETIEGLRDTPTHRGCQ